MKKIEYKLGNIYKLKRNAKFDKNGRPIIFIKYLGDKSLIWLGTTKYKIKGGELPLSLDLNGTITYFHLGNIKECKTDYIIEKWVVDNHSNKLNKTQKQQLIQHFALYGLGEKDLFNLLEKDQKLNHLEKLMEAKNKENELLRKELKDNRLTIKNLQNQCLFLTKENQKLREKIKSKDDFEFE